MPKTIAHMRRRLELALEGADEEDAVLELMKKVIERFGFQPQDLFQDSWGRENQRGGLAKNILFRDRQGNTWSGRGRRPLWLVEALANGASLEDFRMKGMAPKRRSR